MLKFILHVCSFFIEVACKHLYNLAYCMYLVIRPVTPDPERSRMFGFKGKAKHAMARGWKQKVLSSLGAFALVAAASATAVVAAPLAASAHTPSVSSTCEALSVNLTNYAATVPGKDAVPDKTVSDGYVKWVWNGSKQNTAPAFRTRTARSGRRRATKTRPTTTSSVWSTRRATAQMRRGSTGRQ